MAAALALSKNENVPAASAEAPCKDAGTQVDAVYPTARAEKSTYFFQLSVSLFLFSFQQSNEIFFFKNNMLTVSRKNKKNKNISDS